jgi:hypothetical protein
VDLSGWLLNQLTLLVPCDEDCDDDDQTTSTLNLQLTAIAHDTATNTSAASTRAITVQLLNGEPVATPVDANPYVNYAAKPATTQVLKPQQPIVVASALVPVGASSTTISTVPVKQTDYALSMEDWALSLEGAIERELMNMLK